MVPEPNSSLAQIRSPIERRGPNFSSPFQKPLSASLARHSALNLVEISLEEVDTFLDNHRTALKTVLPPSQNDSYVFRRKEYLANLGCDVLGFAGSRSKELAGVFIGHALDWLTYYVRFVALVAPLRGTGFYQRLVKLIEGEAALQGYQLLQVHTSPKNKTHIHVLNKLDFEIRGLECSSSWGSLINFKKELLSTKEEQQEPNDNSV